MQIIPIKSPVIKQGVFLSTLNRLLNQEALSNGDILVIASKVIAHDQNDLVEIKKIQPNRQARKLAGQYRMDSRFVQIILDEADKIIGGVKGTLLTLKNNVVIANAGVDHSNSPKGYFILWPSKLTQAADQTKKHLQKQFKKKLGIIIADSHCLPRRLGTSGFALAIAGFDGVVDQRKKKDLYGRPLKITFSNLADDLAAVASSVMGEAAEKVPFVLIKKAPIKLSNKSATILTDKLKMSGRSCLFSRSRL